MTRRNDCSPRQATTPLAVAMLLVALPCVLVAKPTVEKTYEVAVKAVYLGKTAPKAARKTAAGVALSGTLDGYEHVALKILDSKVVLGTGTKSTLTNRKPTVAVTKYLAAHKNVISVSLSDFTEELALAFLKRQKRRANANGGRVLLYATLRVTLLKEAGSTVRIITFSGLDAHRIDGPGSGASKQVWIDEGDERGKRFLEKFAIKTAKTNQVRGGSDHQAGHRKTMAALSRGSERRSSSRH